MQFPKAARRRLINLSPNAYETLFFAGSGFGTTLSVHLVDSGAIDNITKHTDTRCDLAVRIDACRAHRHRTPTQESGGVEQEDDIYA